MKMPKDIDPEMRELLDVLGAAIRKDHKGPVYRENLHAPYYSRSRWRCAA